MSLHDITESVFPHARVSLSRFATTLFLSLVISQISLAQTQDSAWTPLRTNGDQAPSFVKRDVSPIGSNGGKLDTSHGQIWREYDIRSFTNRLRDQESPEQSVVDWILRETGTNTWFGAVQSVLSADRNRIVVYHTPDVQDLIEQTVARFLDTRSEANEIAVRLVTVNKPDWRVRAQAILTPVKTQTPGIEAWLISRENAALLLHDLSTRTDYREHNTPNLTIYSGQTHTLKATRPRVFSAGYDPLSSALPSSNTNVLDEGFILQISPLVGNDGQTIEAVIKCSVDQVERFTSLQNNTVDQFGLHRQSQIQVPQISSWRLHERFSWPKDEVLLVSRGLVALPERTTKWNESVRKVLNNGGQRGNALLFLESRSEVDSKTRNPRTASQTDSANYRGRY